MKSSCESVEFYGFVRGFACWRESSAGGGAGGCEFYVHLNLVRSCETPSDPTRCPLPPRHPSRPDRGLSCHRRPSFALAALATRAACAIRAQCVRLSWPCLVACGLARYLSPFALHLANPCGLLACLAKPCGLACILADSLMPCMVSCCHRSPFVSFQCFAVYRVSLALSSGFCILVHPCASLAGLALHYSGLVWKPSRPLRALNVSILVQLLIFPCESTTYRT